MIVLVCFKVTLTARGRQTSFSSTHCPGNPAQPQSSLGYLLPVRTSGSDDIRGGKSTGSLQDIPREKETTYIAVKKTS